MNWYLFDLAENITHLGPHTLQLQVLLGDTSTAPSIKSLPCHRIKFTVTGNQYLNHKRFNLCQFWYSSKNIQFGSLTTCRFSPLLVTFLEAHPNKFTVGMLETPLRVGVPFQVWKPVSLKSWLTLKNSFNSYSRMGSDYFLTFFCKIPLNLLDEFNNPSKLADEITPVLSAR